MSETPSRSFIHTYGFSLVLRFVAVIITGLLAIVVFQHFQARQKLANQHTIEIPKRQVPEFSLTERSSTEVTRESLKNKVWVANFIFTTCPTVCPIMTRRMKALQDEVLKQDVELQLVSFSIDPETDTPQELQKYANLHGADPKRWWFLTGHPDTIFNIARYGFALGFVENPEEDRNNIGRYAHSSKFALVDKEGFVRGYYDSQAKAFIQDILRDAQGLRTLY
ncbi:MAG: SCO family protein [Verrucomicrobiota bacterium]